METWIDVHGLETATVAWSDRVEIMTVIEAFEVLKAWHYNYAYSEKDNHHFFSRIEVPDDVDR